jgi:hypothetical protein
MRATAWNNGSHRTSGAGYGIKVRVEDRDRVFRRNWTQILLDIPQQGATRIALSASFWKSCSELRSAALGRWLRESGRAPWPRGAPPALDLKHIDGNDFAVSDNTHQ